MRTLTDEARIRATRLIKQLRSDSHEETRTAAERFLVLDYWRGKSGDDVATQREAIQRKHALDVVAIEFGFRNWLELQSNGSGFNPAVLFERSSACFLNLWFKTYDEARAVLDESASRFLFPHRQHFVVCERNLLEELGIDADHADWNLIGRDWVRPRDPVAWARLNSMMTAWGTARSVA